MNLKVKKYLEQMVEWPSEGKHILAQYTESYIVVYQAYKPSIGEFAVRNQYFGGEYSYSRMSWIKTNFLWMMYRSAWGTKEGQEIILAIKLKIDFFENILKNAVVSNFQGTKFKNREEWSRELKSSNVRLQWDPDHHPNGNKEIRRAVQLGLRSEFLEPFKGDGIIEIEDISQFVKEQNVFVTNGNYNNLVIPNEKIYLPKSEEIAVNIGVDK